MAPIVVGATSVGGVASAAQTLWPGIYMVGVTVADCGAMASAELVVFNPEGGFATGGGWIAPENDGLDAQMRCNFGFNVKYKNGSPAGHITFRYTNDCLDLKSTSIEQLVITGDHVAQFKGWACVNGEDGNWFSVKVVDSGEPGLGSDTVEINVWAPGADPESDPAEWIGGALGGGNISVHAR